MLQRLLSVTILTISATPLVISSGIADARAADGGLSSARAGAHAGAVVALPKSMGAAGDSVTTAFDVNGTGLLKDNPQYSWSTGSIAAVDSEYSRILAKNKAIKGHTYDVAKFGAMMSALQGQMKALASHKVEYATVLMGDNDVCTTTTANMTPVASFRSQFQSALKYFFAHDAKAHVFVSSLNNVYRLWQLFHNNPTAENAWGALATAFLGHGACQSMLSPSNTAGQRMMVLNRERAYNSALAAVCKTFANCRWDNNATFNSKFTTADISTVDYISPSEQGQKDIAAACWKQGYWGK